MNSARKVCQKPSQKEKSKGVCTLLLSCLEVILENTLTSSMDSHIEFPHQT